SADFIVRFWDARTGAAKSVLRGHEDQVMGAAFSPDGRYLATSSADATVRIWDAATHELVTVLSGHGGLVSRVKFSPDGRSVVTFFADSTARSWPSPLLRCILSDLWA